MAEKGDENFGEKSSMFVVRELFKTPRIQNKTAYQRSEWHRIEKGKFVKIWFILERKLHPMTGGHHAGIIYRRLTGLSKANKA